MNWVNYGGGVNSTALLALLTDGKLPQYAPWRVVWADTGDEKESTYDYIFSVIQPWLRKHGKTLEVVCDNESVLERWERLGIVGHRVNRSCTLHAKIRPLVRHIKAHTRKHDSIVQLLGIDAGESHRARPAYKADGFEKAYPLVDLDIDRDECVRIIEAAGLPVPEKSGCWHCPFMRVRDILELATESPEKFQRIVALEKKSRELFPVDEGKVRAQWGDRPALEWARRACDQKSSGPLFQEEHPDPPCGCYDG